MPGFLQSSGVWIEAGECALSHRPPPRPPSGEVGLGLPIAIPVISMVWLGRDAVAALRGTRTPPRSHEVGLGAPIDVPDSMGLWRNQDPYLTRRPPIPQPLGFNDPQPAAESQVYFVDVMPIVRLTRRRPQSLSLPILSVPFPDDVQTVAPWRIDAPAVPRPNRSTASPAFILPAESVLLDLFGPYPQPPVLVRPAQRRVAEEAGIYSAETDLSTFLTPQPQQTAQWTRPIRTPPTALVSNEALPWWASFSVQVGVLQGWNFPTPPIGRVPPVAPASTSVLQDDILQIDLGMQAFLYVQPAQPIGGVMRGGLSPALFNTPDPDAQPWLYTSIIAIGGPYRVIAIDVWCGGIIAGQVNPEND